MNIVEWVLCFLLVVLVGICVFTDCKKSIVPNSILAYTFPIFITLDVLYYLSDGREYLSIFFLNLGLIIVVSVFFYAYHIWAAGDCKLMLACAFGIPGRLYTVWLGGNAASFLIFIITFSAAFLYLMFETVVLRIRNKQYKIAFQKINLPRLLLSYFSTVFSLLCVEGLLHIIIKDNVYDQILTIAFNFLVVLSLIQLRDRMTTRQLFFFSIGSCFAFLALSALDIIHATFSISLRSIALALALIIFSLFSDEYNYQSIHVDELKPGQILSAPSILLFSQSDTAGLPNMMTEDLRARLSKENIESIQKWARTKKGAQYLVIVRKIPFVVFMSIGIFVFLLIGVLRIYDCL